MKCERLAICEDEVRSSVTTVVEARGEVRTEEAEAFEPCELKELVPMLVVCGVCEGCVSSVKVR